MRTRLPLIDLSLWWAFVIEPRKTTNKIIQIKSRSQTIFLAILFGVNYVLYQLANRNVGNFLQLPSILIIAVVAGPIIGIALAYLIGALLHWTGNWLGGQAPAEHLRAAYVWSSLPNLCELLLWLPKLVLFGNELFRTNRPKLESSPILALILLVILIVGIVLNIWSFTLLLRSISEVQRFSIWRALGSIFLSALIVAIPYFVILVLLQGFGLMSYAH